MKVGIIGTGAVGLTYAERIAQRNHEPLLYAPRQLANTRFQASKRVTFIGLVEGTRTFRHTHAPENLSDMDMLIFCLRGNGHKYAMDRVAPHILPGQIVLISSHCSLGALYLSRLLRKRAITVPVLAIATTFAGGAIAQDGRVHVTYQRTEVDIAALPAHDLTVAIDALRRLFDCDMTQSPNVIAISLNNLNPQIHLANALLNFTRIENAEPWDNFSGITPGVGRLIAQLDKERLAIARAFQAPVRTVHEHYLKSYPGPHAGQNIHEMAQAIKARRSETTPGPTNLSHRFLTEDLPFGIACTLALARIAQTPAPLHASGMALMSACCGHDFQADNDLLPCLGLETATVSSLQCETR